MNPKLLQEMFPKRRQITFQKIIRSTKDIPPVTEKSLGWRYIDWIPNEALKLVIRKALL